ncbi:branched-chain amino acid transport protein AzlD [mine drainage metagenome]|uniref:Branched-chain amino acid transport protein AzlD n=1 Tax=mine drainage metagenome TaxID=410659 RepID=A0A1J5QTD3_9ZZZZ
MISSTAIWVAIIASSVGAYALKLAGMSMPQAWLAAPRVQRIAGLIPVALLTALVVVQSVTTHHSLVLDGRAAGLAVAIALLMARASFPVVVISAALVSALIHHF